MIKQTKLFIVNTVAYVSIASIFATIMPVCCLNIAPYVAYLMRGDTTAAENVSNAHMRRGILTVVVSTSSSITITCVVFFGTAFDAVSSKPPQYH